MAFISSTRLESSLEYLQPGKFSPVWQTWIKGSGGTVRWLATASPTQHYCQGQPGQATKCCKNKTKHLQPFQTENQFSETFVKATMMWPITIGWNVRDPPTGPWWPCPPWGRRSCLVLVHLKYYFTASLHLQIQVTKLQSFSWKLPENNNFGLVWFRVVESESLKVGKSLKIGKNRIWFLIRLFGKNAKMPALRVRVLHQNIFLNAYNSGTRGPT